MLLNVDTAKSMDQIREDMAKACAAHKFGVIAVHDLKAKMKEKGVDYQGECLIFEVCNPQKAKEVLEANPEISTALPCRVSVYRTPSGGLRLSTLRPTKVLEVYSAAGLASVAAEVESTLEAIMKEAAR